METTIKPAKVHSEINPIDQKYPVCPWCGFEHNDPYPRQFDEEGVVECENCSHDFELIFVHHYTTTRVIKSGYGYKEANV